MSNETRERPSRGDERDREIDAKHQLEEVQRDLRVAENRVRIQANDMRQLQAAKGGTAESGHKALDDVEEAAQGRLDAEIRDYLPTLKAGDNELADPPPPRLAAAFVAARFGPELFEAIHTAIDDDVTDPSSSTYTIATEGELDDAIVEKRAEQKVAREQAEKLAGALREAEAEYNDSIEGR